MFSKVLLEKFVKAYGPRVIQEMERYPDGTYHYGFTQTAKSDFIDYVQTYALKRDVTFWDDLFNDLESKFKVTDITHMDLPAPIAGRFLLS